MPSRILENKERFVIDLSSFESPSWLSEALKSQDEEFSRSAPANERAPLKSPKSIEWRMPSMYFWQLGKSHPTRRSESSERLMRIVSTLANTDRTP